MSNIPFYLLSITLHTGWTHSICGQVWQLSCPYQVQRKYCSWEMGINTTRRIQNVLQRRKVFVDCWKDP